MGAKVLIVFNFFFLVYSGAICPDHWTRNEETCYFHDMYMVTFKEATEKCTSFNATLVSIHSLKHNDWINRFVSEHYTWLGAISTSDKKINSSNSQDFKITNQNAKEKVLNKTQLPTVTITVSRIPDKVDPRIWTWIDGSPFNYWAWSKGDWFGMIPRQPDCNSSCCTIFMNEVGSWVDEDCYDPRRLASTLCALRFNAITSSVEYENESKLTISSEVSTIEKILSYIEGNFVTKEALDDRSNQLVARGEINKRELWNKTTGTWVTPVIVILSLITISLILTNAYLFYQLRKLHIFSSLNLSKFNFKTLNNQVSEEVSTINEEV